MTKFSIVAEAYGPFVQILADSGSNVLLLVPPFLNIGGASESMSSSSSSLMQISPVYVGGPLGMIAQNALSQFRSCQIPIRIIRIRVLLWNLVSVAVITGRSPHSGTLPDRG